MAEVHAFQGCYGFSGGNLYAGTVNIHGKPDGKGTLYYLDSGECDVGVFGPELNQIGPGVRFNRERDKAFALEDGTLKAQIANLDRALDRVGLEKAPEERHK
ncbi:unnamed protein product, partial [Polarella glacialis]